MLIVIFQSFSQPGFSHFLQRPGSQQDGCCSYQPPLIFGFAPEIMMMHNKPTTKKRQTAAWSLLPRTWSFSTVSKGISINMLGLLNISNLLGWKYEKVSEKLKISTKYVYHTIFRFCSVLLHREFRVLPKTTFEDDFPFPKVRYVSS